MSDDRVGFRWFARAPVDPSWKAGVAYRWFFQKRKNVPELRRNPARRGAEAALPVRSGRGACSRAARLELGRAQCEVSSASHRGRRHPFRSRAGRVRGRGTDGLPQGARDEPARARPQGVPQGRVPESVLESHRGARAPPGTRERADRSACRDARRSRGRAGADGLGRDERVPSGRPEVPRGHQVLLRRRHDARRDGREKRLLAEDRVEADPGVPEKDACMPLVIVTAEHPSETDLLDLAAGREAGDATAAAKKHVDAGCRLCARRLGDLSHLVSAVKEESAFNAILESEAVPELPRQAMGRTLPFVNAKAKSRTSVEDIYRLSQAAEKPAELIVDAARAGADELAAAMRSLDGTPYRGFALLYAAQKAFSLVPEDPNKALALAKLLSDEAESLAPANSRERISAPAPRQAVQAEAALLESQALLQKGEAAKARGVLPTTRTLFRESGDLGFGAALCDYYEGAAIGFERDYAAAERFLKRALGVFTEFGQDHLVGRAEAALGSMLAQRGDFARALPHFDRALETLEAAAEPQRVSMTLNNKATTLMREDRFDEARATFAKALNLARRHGFA